MRDHALCSIRDASIWKSYRRAALRSKHAVGRNSNSDESIAVTLHQLENDGSLAVGELADVNAVENDPEKKNLRTEIRRLRRLIRKKDFLIDLLMEKIVKLQKSEISATEDGVESGEYRDPIRCHPSSSMISMDLSCDDPRRLQGTAPFLQHPV
ncbi:hypothetical protein KIN20_007802 [Parelaphostrongylus tenuis]|uniref:Uncharacterized protein n=1 Tax=Parelaphostrongylus tenuis TaxID=148309 RepID=A0AAD5QH27_PARTN|nr:hypothetical protein KIN20_007802 [Parelaphostrongylus tenuis]